MLPFSGTLTGLSAIVGIDVTSQFFRLIQPNENQ